MTDSIDRSGTGRRRTVSKHEALRAGVWFSVSTGALFLLDLYVASRLAASEVAAYAFARNVVLFVGGVAALGVDQAMIRAPQHPSEYLGKAARQTAAVAVLTPVIAWASGYGVREMIGLYLATAALGLLMIIAGSLRADLHVTPSIVVVHAWKVPLAVLIVIVSGPVVADRLAPAPAIAGIFAVVLVGWAVLSVAVVRHLIDPLAEHGRDYRSLAPTARRFLVLAIIANGISYGDQLILQADGQQASATTFFVYVSLFAPISLFTTGYLANLIAPYLRSRRLTLRESLSKHVSWFLLLGAGLTVITVVVGFGLGSMLGRFDGGVRPGLVAAVCAVSLLRYAYVGPSAVVGVFGTRHELDRLVVVGAGALVGYVAAYMLLVGRGADPLLAISVGAVGNAGVRTVNAAYLARRVISNNRDLVVSV